MSEPQPETLFADKFREFFLKPAAVSATSSLSNGVEIEFRVQLDGEKPVEIFCLLRREDRNEIRTGPGDKPQITMTLTPRAAAEVAAHPADRIEDVGQIGILFASLAASPNPERKVRIQFNAGFLTLLSKGFVGVVTSGGKTFASYLASKGLNGVGAIKSIVSKFGKK